MDKDIILLTGGAGNIATAITKKYLENDCIVIALDIVEENPNEEFYDNVNYDYYQVDVTDIEALKDVCKKIESKYGRVTHVISSAGNPARSEFNGIENVTDEDINKSVALNLTSHIYLTKVFVPLIKKDMNKNKTITFVSSINAIKNFDIPVYSAAKAGLYGFVKGIGKELGNARIRVNAISPGTVPTPIDIKENDGILEYKKNMTALGEFASTSDIADTIFSVTHCMKTVVGQNIVVDAGQTL